MESSEACFLVRSLSKGRENIIEMIEREVIHTEFNLNAETKAIKQLITKYNNIPMSLADACLVRMAELFKGAKIITLDSDFTLYRKNKKHIIGCLTPFDE